MPLEDVCVHRCTPILTEQPDGPDVDGGGVWIEGEWYPLNPDEPGEGGSPPPPSRGVPFDGCLFLPRGEEGGAANVVVLGGRQVRRPTLLFLPENDVGEPVALDPKDRVAIVAEELNEAEGRPAAAEVEWLVDGKPQPFGKPGDDVIGFLAILAKVEGE